MQRANCRTISLLSLPSPFEISLIQSIPLLGHLLSCLATLPSNTLQCHTLYIMAIVTYDLHLLTCIVCTKILIIPPSPSPPTHTHTNSHGAQSFWVFIDPLVPDEIRMQLLALRNADSDIMKCRSWVRLMLSKSMMLSFLEDLQRHPGLLS